jgi:hypothetical protein
LLLYPLTLGGGKRLFPEQKHAPFALENVKQFPTGVVLLHDARSAG